jgi:phospholipid transport system transporter-binding protein
MPNPPERSGVRLQLSGDLTAPEVTAIYTESLAWRTTGALPVVVDLAGVARADSSALALLLEWQAWAHGRGAVIEFADPPQALRTFASLSEVNSLLGWPDEILSL